MLVKAEYVQQIFFPQEKGISDGGFYEGVMKCLFF